MTDTKTNERRIKMKALGLAIMVIAFMGIIIVGGWGIWRATRQINYELAYKGLVQQTVREMVKQGSLK